MAKHPDPFKYDEIFPLSK